MSHIFISYSHEDSDYAHKLAEALEQAGFAVWIDNRIDYGTQWPHVIQEQLDSCAAFVVIMTPRSFKSKWVQNELNRAMRKEKPLFPLLLEGDEPWLAVESIQYTDVTDERLPPSRFYNTLSNFVQRHIQSDVLHAESVEVQDIQLTAVKAVPVGGAESHDIASPLPMMEWCSIPAGATTIEGKISSVNTFRISKYPVTNAQYQVFIDDPDGYQYTGWWDYSSFARDWRRKNNRPAIPTFKGEDYPRETVCWYEAVAFCYWLSDKTGLSIMLPTEQEWQRAAQGDNSLRYPWGDKFDKTRCNTSESGNRQTTPVERYITGISPYGVYDMAGNVWEWTLTEFESKLSNIKSNASRVLHGGSWNLSGIMALAAYRYQFKSSSRGGDVGFRIVTVAPEQSPSV